MSGTGDKAMGGARSAARLAAVQALYQIEQSGEADPERVVAEFIRHRLGQEIDGALFAEPDRDLFRDIVIGTMARCEEIDAHLAAVLKAGWTLARLQSVLRSALRAGIYELMARPDIPTAVVIDEYLDIIRAFMDDAETGFANGILDRLGRELRSGRG